jgi:hypothetical protein
MKLIGAGMIVLCATSLSAQRISTTVTEITRFEVKDGRVLKVNGCVQRFKDTGYMLTNEAGDLKYVLVTNTDLRKLVGRRVEIEGLGADSDEGTILIEKVVGTSGQFGVERIDGEETKQSKEIAGDVGFPYLSVESVRKLANRCR